MINKNLGAIILAAGRGKRMKLKNGNKTTLLLNGRPLITYPVALLEKMNIEPIIIVVGHAKASVQKALINSKIIYVTQAKRLGTGHAVKSAVPSIPGTITDILVMNGDDSYSYKEEILRKMIMKHKAINSSVTLLTIKVEKPAGLGRVVRNDQNRIIEIVEEKDAASSQKLINEINPNCYIFQVKFLKKYLSKISKNSITGEYYLPELVKLAYIHNEKITDVSGGLLPWRGINTQEELIMAQKTFKYD